MDIEREQTLTKRRVHESCESAVQEAARLCMESPSGIVLISDVDDTLVASFPILLNSLNQRLAQGESAWEYISDEEIINAPSGRLDDTRAADCARHLGTTFEVIWGEICQDPKNSESMLLLPGSKEFLHTLSLMGIPLVGYLTSRPASLYEATDTNFDSLDLPVAPIFGPGHDGNAAEDKVAILSQLLTLIPSYIRIIFADDRVDTCLAIKEAFGDQVVALVIATTRNGKGAQILKEKGIAYGSFEDHLQYLKEVTSGKSKGGH